MSYENFIKLTETDKIILNSYKNMILSLGKYLGEGYEIILHSLENLEHSIIENFNGHYSGRKNGAPITDLALSMLNNIKEENMYNNICYTNTSKQGETLRASTIPILGENNRIIGLICINFYTNISLIDIINKFIPNKNIYNQKENFVDDTDTLIETMVNKIKERILNDKTISSSNKNKEIIINLHKKGIFNIKDSAIKVADLLGISKNTVYLHIRNIK